MVGIGNGRDTGTLVLDRPAPGLVFSRGRASLRGLTGLVAVSGVEVGVSDGVSVGAGAELVPLVTLVSPELFSISINKLFSYHLSGNFSPVKCIHDTTMFYH